MEKEKKENIKKEKILEEEKKKTQDYESGLFKKDYNIFYLAVAFFVFLFGLLFLFFVIYKVPEIFSNNGLASFGIFNKSSDLFSIPLIILVIFLALIYILLIIFHKRGKK
jgi:uncharacterized membrane protein